MEPDILKDGLVLCMRKGSSVLTMTINYTIEFVVIEKWLPKEQYQILGRQRDEYVRTYL
jgi:hypothetical protein